MNSRQKGQGLRSSVSFSGEKGENLYTSSSNGEFRPKFVLGDCFGKLKRKIGLQTDRWQDVCLVRNWEFRPGMQQEQKKERKKEREVRKKEREVRW